jgi:DNA-binding transcriptional ArsR family regulator
MDVETQDANVSRIAAAIAEPARTRILYCLMDGRARTSTELAAVADVSPATASVHLGKLKEQRLVKMYAQGRHRYYSLEGPTVAAALEALSVLTGRARVPFVSSTPAHLTAARTCYDHMAGTLAVAIHERFKALGWLRSLPNDEYDIEPAAGKTLRTLGVDIEDLRRTRRRFAFACMDWSERQPHIGGALGAALLSVALRRKWVTQELDSRALRLTAAGRRELRAKFGVEVVLSEPVRA